MYKNETHFPYIIDVEMSTERERPYANGRSFVEKSTNTSNS